ncbi:hypothetical protein [Nocardia mangyaensis]|uniref:hypothetical protein n=1 Tax=Nocardia mangyaensis TaxID=2213200 RepID=UPI002675E780|nr:hypothetical protein [Nocardia mangyaensis]MDO3651108.1 hypothetical protein [Nocardia mangyaensis]
MRYLLTTAEVGFDRFRAGESGPDEECTTVWSADEVDDEGVHPDIEGTDWSLGYLREHSDSPREFCTHSAAMRSVAHFQ